MALPTLFPISEAGHVLLAVFLRGLQLLGDLGHAVVIVGSINARSLCEQRLRVLEKLRQKLVCFDNLCFVLLVVAVLLAQRRGLRLQLKEGALVLMQRGQDCPANEGSWTRGGA